MRLVRVSPCLGLRCAAALHAAVEVHHQRGGVEFGKRGDRRLIVVCVAWEEGETQPDDRDYG